MSAEVTMEGDHLAISLAYELQFEEINCFESKDKGKQQVGEVSDLKVALDLYSSELMIMKTFHQDSAFCTSISNAVEKDASLIATLEAEELTAQCDRQMAQRLAGRSTSGSRDTAEASSAAQRALQKLESLKLSTDSAAETLNGDEVQGESSTWAESRASKVPKRECIICGDGYSAENLAECPCGHEYCRECLNTLFEARTKDESLFPPRCCNQKILIDDYRLFFTDDFVGRFKAKEIELQDTNRTYCHVATCSSYIPVQFVRGEVATCVQCSSRTCIHCKEEEHENECAQDTQSQELLRVAKENGWQRCYQCRSVVELGTGCFHMTCRCRAEFCYKCGAKWKTCTCEQWEEQRLLDRANQVVHRNNRNNGLNAQQRDAQVARAQQHLRRHHDCGANGHNWRYDHGAGTCEVCNERMPTFTFECARCYMSVCKRCRYNRL